MIHDEAIRLTRLLDDLLDLSVLENRTVQLSLSVGNLQDLIGRAVQMASHVRADREFTVLRDTISEFVPVITDADRLVQVLINLISNARKYCDAPDPQLRIAVRERRGRITIDLIDNGTGIPRGEQDRIFEKFARLEDRTGAGGAGLGLAICREIMVNLGGSVGYLPGQGGAAFRISLPVRAGAEQAA